MAYYSNRVDSAELLRLRERYQLDHPNSRANARRLGSYASVIGVRISDYGAHSKRWIDQFNAGYRQA